MAAINQLDSLLKQMSPQLDEKEYVFCTLDDNCRDLVQATEVFATIREDEGMTLILEKKLALSLGLKFSDCFKKITLKVHSSLTAIGLTAAVSSELASVGVSANIVAGFYHDHVFIPKEKAQIALNQLNHLSARAQAKA